MPIYKTNKIRNVKVYNAETKELISTINNPLPVCPLFEFCNCRTATCKVVLPDDSCYWYRYFKTLIKEREEEI